MARYACPVVGCDYITNNVDSLAGHIGGKQSFCEDHDDYGEVRRFELFSCKVTQ